MATEETQQSTEEKIKEAARKVFTRKGFAATRTRDIAEESGYNLALINYYFRSKEKLFEIVMFENIQHFVKGVLDIVTNETTELESKIEHLVQHYIEMLIANPGLPMFVLNTVQSDPEQFFKNTGINSENRPLHMVKQIRQMAEDGKMPPINPVHIYVNMMSLILFPFLGAPMIKHKGSMSDEQFNALMRERIILIPRWIKAMLQNG